MQYEMQKTGDTVNIVIKDQLIYSDTVNFSVILQEFASNPAAHCVLTLEHLDHIDSSGLRMFFLLHDVCKEKGADLAIKQAHGQVRDMLLHCRFDTLVTIGG